MRHFKEINSGLVFSQFLKLFLNQFKAHKVAVNEFLLHGAFLRVRNIHYETLKSSNGKLCCIYLIT